MKGVGEVLEVMNPVADVDVKQVAQGPRLTLLTGKKIGLCSNRKPGATATLDRVAERLGEELENVTFERFNFAFPFPPAAIQQMAESNCDGFVAASAD